MRVHSTLVSSRHAVVGGHHGAWTLVTSIRRQGEAMRGAAVQEGVGLHAHRWQEQFVCRRGRGPLPSPSGLCCAGLTQLTVLCQGPWVSRTPAWLSSSSASPSCPWAGWMPQHSHRALKPRALHLELSRIWVFVPTSPTTSPVTTGQK